MIVGVTELVIVGVTELVIVGVIVGVTVGVTRGGWKVLAETLFFSNVFIWVALGMPSDREVYGYITQITLLCQVYYFGGPSYCWHTTGVLLPHCCHTTAALLPHCCHTAATLLPHCCHTAATLLPHCCHTAAKKGLVQAWLTI